MLRLGVVAALLLMGVFESGCRRSEAPVSFPQLAEDFVYGSLAISPVAATSAGYHEHNGVKLDEQIDDYSAAGLTNQHNFYTSFRDRLSKVDREKLSAEDRADYDIIHDQIAASLLELDTIQSYRHNPTVYVELAGNALFNPYVLEYAPKPARFRQIIERLTRLRALFQEAKKNLRDSPDLWNRVAQEENDGNIELVDKTLRAACPPELKDEYQSAAAGALDALRAFDTFLKTTLPRHTSDWRLGKEKYAQKFQYTLAIGKTPADVLADAEAELKAVREHMADIARPESVESALNRIAQKHATPDTYFQDAKRDLAEVTQFVRDKKLLTLPAGSNLQVIPTPEFVRGIYAVGGFNPAPALEPQLGAFYWITPIPKDWPKERIESKLREYNFYGLKILTIHEAMPGHYVQFEFANEVQPKYRRLVRSVYSNAPYVEGWAVYATQMVIDEGYYKNDKAMQLTWGKQLLRVISNTILDIRMQMMGMTDQQAMDLMINQTYQEKEEATAKLQRAKLSSCQLPTYFVGWRGWLSVRDQYRKDKGAAFNLAEFHDRALEQGAVPLPQLGRLLGAR